MKLRKNPSRIEHLAQLADQWSRELRELGARPPRRTHVAAYLSRVRPWIERETAIAGAAELVAELAGVDMPVDQRVAQLRRAGLTFAAAARALGIPVGSVKTHARRWRLAAASGGAA